MSKLVKFCKICGAELPKGRRVFCSQKCARFEKYKNASLRDRETKIIDRVPVAFVNCKLCGKSFPVTHKRLSYCCDECRDEGLKQIKAAYYRETKWKRFS